MPDLLDASGLQTKSLNDLISDLTTELQVIYGADINVESNSPDGEMINIFCQAGTDIRELLVYIFNSFNPDSASGSVLDARVAINNIQRLGGSYTIQPIDLVVDRTVELVGLDGDYNNPDGTGYTVQDDNGTQYVLIDSVTLTAGSYTKNFRAQNIGAVTPTLSTITSAVTIVLGVTSIENTVAALEIGEDQETDVALRIRRSRSTANGASAYINALLGTVLNLDGVTAAKLYENYTSTTDSNGIPGHCIWLIVEGGANTDIGEVISAKKTPGTNMKGSVFVNIATPHGPDFVAIFDRPSAKPLYIRFDIQPTESGVSFDQTAIKNYIAENLSFEIGQFSDTSSITYQAINAISESGGGGVPVNVEISSDGLSWVDYIEVDTLDEQWAVDSSRITITEL